MLHEGRILEGLTSNFFHVKNGRLGTAQHGVLKGVTRHEVLQVARIDGIEIFYEALPFAEIGKIGEAFLTSSSRGIVPIVEVDGIQIGSGAVGPLTKRLMQLYQADVEQRIEVI